MDRENSNRIVVVSGLPRSGTSMVMQMLEAAGIPILTDHVRTADGDNPSGYYEYERVKKLRTDKDWLQNAVGKAVKVISYLLMELPESFDYDVVFIRRSMPEVLASQRRMLVRRGEPADKQSDEAMAAAYGKHLKQVADWLGRRGNVRVMYIEHRDTIERSEKVAASVNEFLGGAYDIDAMTGVVDSKLYRQRA